MNNTIVLTILLLIVVAIIIYESLAYAKIISTDELMTKIRGACGESDNTL